MDIKMQEIHSMFNQLINQNQINMYKVNFYKNRELTNSSVFTTERKAITCLESHASYDSLKVTNGQWYASSGGNIPEQEIEIVKI